MKTVTQTIKVIIAIAFAFAVPVLALTAPASTKPVSKPATAIRAMAQLVAPITLTSAGNFVILSNAVILDANAIEKK